MSDAAVLIGPFIGDLRTEMFCFAPYIIYLRKKFPDSIKIIVYTRPDRFDLYGKYANILVPLKDSDQGNQIGFWENSYTNGDYNHLIYDFKKHFQKRYNVVEQIYPRIDKGRYLLRWQFPKIRMDYKFCPRNKNNEKAKFFLDNRNNVFVDSVDHFYNINSKNHNLINIKQLDNIKFDNYITKTGVIIEILKHCDFCIGNLSSIYTHLSLLLGTKTVLVNEEIDDVDINVLNPLKTRYRKVNYENLI